MRHLNGYRKLGRTSAHRMSMLRNLCTSLILEERIETTLPKAKELRPFAEKAITLGRRGLNAESPSKAVHLRRIAATYFHAGNQTGPDRRPDGGYKRPRPVRTAGVAAVQKLFDELGPRFSERPGGYTRIVKLGPRKGDGAEMAIIELLGSENRRLKSAKPTDKAPAEEQGRKGLIDRLKSFGRSKKTEADEKGDE
jgi:large subunit ribosomal protein L17